MIAFCTCGAQLPDDALFCHKCGKPQREVVPVEAEEPAPDFLAPPVAAAPAAALPLAINFQNRIAVRTALLSALIGTLLIQVPLPVFIGVFWFLLSMLVAGFFAVYLYQRRTGEFLTARNGARMGWLTGVFCFLILLVLMVPLVLAMQQSGGLKESFRERMESMGGSGMNVEEALKILESPTTFGMIIMLVLLFQFLMLTGLTMIGGALGAKVLEKE
ncbi:MAG: zinc ribbon domain-containing protein [Acidimicrobiia bacterium]|nr:zinc ribbon domain-containing protein [Acidimicrobiia bacterium]